MLLLMIMPIPHADGNTDTYNEKTEVVYGIHNTTLRFYSSYIIHTKTKYLHR